MQTIEHSSAGGGNLSSKKSAKFANSEMKGSFHDIPNTMQNNASLSPRLGNQLEKAKS